MKKLMMMLCLVSASIAMTACSATKFGNDGGASSKSTDGAVDELGNDAQDTDDDMDEDKGPVVTVPEFIDILTSEDPLIFDPVLADQIIEDNECCLKHGRGKGLELCQAGNELCIPNDEVVANAAMYANATVGRCR